MAKNNTSAGKVSSELGEWGVRLLIRLPTQTQARKDRDLLMGAAEILRKEKVLDITKTAWYGMGEPGYNSNTTAANRLVAIAESIDPDKGEEEEEDDEDAYF